MEQFLIFRFTLLTGSKRVLLLKERKSIVPKGWSVEVENQQKKSIHKTVEKWIAPKLN